MSISSCRAAVRQLVGMGLFSSRRVETKRKLKEKNWKRKKILISHARSPFLAVRFVIIDAFVVFVKGRAFWSLMG
jgi:hypothetical protein